MTRDELLSRYLDGDLSADEVAHVEAKLAADPTWRQAWTDVNTMTRALASLPRELEPPPLQTPRPVREPARGAPWVVTVVALAAALAASLWPRSAPTIWTTGSDHLVTGEVRIAIGPHEIDVDGRAHIHVEPIGALVRESARNIDSTEHDVNTKLLLAAAAGATVTVVVLEGTAWLTSDEGAPTTLTAGERRVLSPGHPVAPAPTRNDAVSRAEDLAREIALLQTELQATRDALDTEQFAGALARGQLAAMQGKPAEWPTDVPQAFTADHFEHELSGQLEDFEDYRVDRVECSEYPCIAVIEYTGDDRVNWDPESGIGESLSGWLDTELGEDHRITVNTSHFRKDGREGRFVLLGAFTMAPESENLTLRTDFRVDTLVDDLGDEVARGLVGRSIPDRDTP